MSSAFAVPAAAGIPVTHRGLATSVTVVTGHVGDPSTPGGVDWDVARPGRGTLVILMGMSERARISPTWSPADGRPRHAGGRGALGDHGPQQVVRSTLAGLAAVDLPAPSVIVVGPVAALDLAPGHGGDGSG